MSNVVPFPITRARPAGLPPAFAPADADVRGPMSLGEILLFTGVHYMRRPLSNEGGESAGRPADPRGSGRPG